MSKYSGKYMGNAFKAADISFCNNIFKVSGHLDFSNVTSIFNKSMVYINHPRVTNAQDNHKCDYIKQTLTFDFSKVESSNSAGLALIIEWVKLAKKQDKQVNFINLTPELISIAKVSGIDGLLSI